MEYPTYGLVGRGRLASHLAHYLQLEGRSVARWHRGHTVPPHSVLGNSDVVLLAISDDALTEFIAAHPELGDKTLVHFSGSFTVRGVDCAHPLMTFDRELYDLETYRRVPFITDRGGAAFSELFPGLDNPSWSVEPEQKPLYHALCVLSGNFTTILWSKAMEDFESKLGLPREVLRPYLERTAVNTLEHGRSSLTGSLDRGDRSTIARDLEGLAGDPFREVYVAISDALSTMETKS
jgi:predicted short-subunit dehydrogenase-like oxidoreductase (DUF2520 family)